MKRVGLAVLMLVLAHGLGCHPVAHQKTVDTPGETVELIEDSWPNGQLRLRKYVQRQDDGTSVDHGSFERWHDNGEREYEADFIHGKKDGTTRRYHKNGQLSSEQEYANGKRDGHSISWDAAGVKVKEEHWADGQAHGTWTVWKDGKIKWQNQFEHGKPVPSTLKP
jgi:antitoxin component YwqK of YwqJK toxin-antitoxin module